MGVTQPLGNLLQGLGLCGTAHDPAMGFKDIVPILNVCHRRLGNTQVIAPPVRESLQSGTFGGSQSADGVSALNSTGAFGYEGGLQFRLEGRCELGILALVEGIPADAVANGGGVFVITSKNGGSLTLGHLGKTAGGHGVDQRGGRPCGG